MRYVYKQLTKELCKDRVFVGLLAILAVLPSFMYFFVHFSVDGNLRNLEEIGRAGRLSKNQELYQIGLISNGILARNVLMAFAALMGFAFALYFYRFFKGNRVEMGCLKALGFTDREMGRFFVLLAVGLALCGASVGLAGGYVVSDVLIRANEEAYMVDGLVKRVSLTSILSGFFMPAAVAGIVGFCSYGMIRGREAGILMAGAEDGASMKRMLVIADRIAGFVPAVPESRRRSVRLAIRRPIPVLLILIASACFSIMFIMAYSLTLSSSLIYESQTAGHSYLYQTTFETVQLQQDGSAAGSELHDGEVRYLSAPGTLDLSGNHVEQKVIGFGGNSDVFQLQNSNGEILPAPTGLQLAAGKPLEEKYGLKAGDVVSMFINGRQWKMTVTHIVFNAELNSIYIEKKTMEKMLAVPSGSYNGIWSMDQPEYNSSDLSGRLTDTVSGSAGAVIQTHEEKLNVLRRDSVSNRSSAVINQVIGCLIGYILLYLALFLNFQDSARDIRILRLMGYEPGEIRGMLIDIYRPILWLSFLITLWPCIALVKGILRSLSLQIGDYMPFQTNVFVIIGIFLLQTSVYWMVQLSFQRSIRNATPLLQGEN